MVNFVFKPNKDSNNGVQLQIEELNVQISRVFIRLELIQFVLTWPIYYMGFYLVVCKVRHLTYNVG